MALAPDPDLPLLHTRNYDIRSFRISDTEILIRGSVLDRKPPGWFIPEDLTPLDVHHMGVDLTLTFPGLIITAIDVQFESYPQAPCPTIAPNYEALLGESIARGFLKTVKDLFGGPRGCSHVGALLQAMAPVAIQTIWSMQSMNAAMAGGPAASLPATAEERIGPSRNTCHVWADDGPMLPGVMRGEAVPVMLTVRRRLAELGHDEATWAAHHRRGPQPAS
ncbi:MAG: hypothetical protein JWL70_569 [Acidimicrobiia bacterium]|nr:hypothetical protein [Acidimicrobiia bacterium]